MKELSEAVNKIITTGHYQFTTPKKPEDDKPFPMPGPMLETETEAEEHIEVEPPTKPKIIETKTDGAFVQSFNEEKNKSDEESEEESTTPKLKKPTTATSPTTKATISPKPNEIKKSKPKKEKQDEIVLNGHRYKLIAVEETSTESPDSSETSTSAIESSEREDLKKMEISKKPTIVQKTESKVLRVNLTEPSDQLLPMVILLLRVYNNEYLATVIFFKFKLLFFKLG